ncbi:MAG: glycoside hydrolase family 25 protein [Clostridium sp.]|jgi:GH25 family lysozyme M1 (1,4-beta-N-acetylmuramidase)|nr:glycoside hydrolase family 25 protein [Clostridium sp.]
MKKNSDNQAPKKDKRERLFYMNDYEAEIDLEYDDDQDTSPASVLQSRPFTTSDPSGSSVPADSSNTFGNDNSFNFVDSDKSTDPSALSQTPARPGKTKKTGPIAFIFTLLGCVAILAIIICAAIVLYFWYEKKGPFAESDQALYTQEELDIAVALAAKEAKESYEQTEDTSFEAGVRFEADRILNGIAQNITAGQNIVEALRPFYPDKIVIGSGGKTHFVPIQENLKKRIIEQENLVILENGEYQYWVDGKLLSRKGIDVSSHQGTIDWPKVKAAGIEFAIIRVGYRGYGSEGRMMADEQFTNNIEGAIAAGVDVGVYYFSQAITTQEALDEANYVLEKIAPYNLTYPVVMDVERVSDAGGRMNKISSQDRTLIAQTFLDRIAERGYDVMLYHNTEMGALMLEIDKLEEYDKWYAYYGSDLYYPYEYKIWQYTNQGRVDGITGDVDLNIGF